MSDDESKKNSNTYAIVFRETLNKYTETSDNEWKIIYDSRYNYGPEPSVTEEYPHLEGDNMGCCYCSVSDKRNHSIANWTCNCGKYKGKCGRRCVCTNHLIHFYIIENTINGKRLQIGQDCGEKYTHIQLYKKCKRCDRHDKPRRKGPKMMSSQDLCKICAKKQIFTFGIHKGKTYWEVYKNYSDYCRYVMRMQDATGLLKKFRDWLIDLIDLNDSFTIINE